MNPFKPASLLNEVKNRFLPLPRNATEGYEQEPIITDFECIKELGIGSFGKVYLVYHKVTKAKYALKSIDKLDEVNYEEKSYFSREIEIMYKLNHPNICKLYSHFEDDNYCYFLLQYIPKGSAYDIIPKNGKKQKNVKLVASVMKDLMSAIYYLHNMNPPIIHRDIKPENILLDENSKAYLTDFGWSNYIRNNRSRSTICGTPLYLPPEMVTESGHNEKADIWCIGVLLFELMTGKVPFEGNDYTSVKYNIMKINISWPSDMDPEVKDLISKILKKNPNERLSIEKILSHSFFTKYFPNAVKELIKPDDRPMKIFVVSTDDPNTWNPEKARTKSVKFQDSTSYQNSSNNNNNTINNNTNNNSNSNSNNNSNNNVTLVRNYKKTKTVCYMSKEDFSLSNHKMTNQNSNKTSNKKINHMNYNSKYSSNYNSNNNQSNLANANNSNTNYKIENINNNINNVNINSYNNNNHKSENANNMLNKSENKSHNSSKHLNIKLNYNYNQKNNINVSNANKNSVVFANFKRVNNYTLHKNVRTTNHNMNNKSKSNFKNKYNSNYNTINANSSINNNKNHHNHTIYDSNNKRKKILLNSIDKYPMNLAKKYDSFNKEDEL